MASDIMIVWFTPAKIFGSAANLRRTDVACNQPQSVSRLQHFLVNEPDAKTGKTHDRRNGVDTYSDQTRHLADAKKHDHGDQIDKTGDGLHHVKNRRDGRLCAIGLRHPDAQRDANADTDSVATEMIASVAMVSSMPK